MKNLIASFFGLAAILVGVPAFAQSTATPVTPGYLSTSGCTPGQTVCFVPYGPAGGPGGAITAAAGSYAAGAIVDLGTGVSPGANTTNGILKLIQTNTAGPVPVTPRNALSSDASSTVTTGGAFQTALAQNTSRLNCTIQNNDSTKPNEPLLISTASSPNAGNSYVVPYTYTWTCTQGLVVMGDAIKITAATTGHTFVETSQ